MTRDAIIQMLQQPLDASRLKQRQGGGGMMLDYLPSHDVIDNLNAIFGFDGWSSDTRTIQQVGKDSFYSIVTLTVEFEGKVVTKTGVGYGTPRADRNTGVISDDAVEMAIKGAESDALKRAARQLGNQFGNSLYGGVAAQPIGNVSYSNGNAQPAQSSYRAPAPSSSQYERRECPKCKGDMWDNRTSKRAPNHPDFKCKDKNCDGVIWPPRDEKPVNHENTHTGLDRAADAAIRADSDPFAGEHEPLADSKQRMNIIKWAQTRYGPNFMQMLMQNCGDVNTMTVSGAKSVEAFLESLPPYEATQAAA